MTILQNIFTKKIAVVTLLMLPAIMMTSEASFAKTCASESIEKSETRSGVNAKSRAKSQAKRRWSDAASSEYGRKYRHWSKSKDKDFGGCREAFYAGWTCSYKAIPCK